MSDTNQATTITDFDHAPAHCGMIVATVAAKVGSSVVEDGILKITANAQGNTDNWFPIEISAAEAARAQIEALEKGAQAKGRASFRFQITGPVEMDYAPSELVGNPERQLKLHVAAATVRPVHPSPYVDPHSNTVFLFGQIQDKGWSMEFIHLNSSVEEDKSPLAVKLTKQAQADVAHLKGKNVAVVGTLSRQQSTEARTDDKGTTYNPYDHVSLAITTAQQCTSFAGKSRYNGGGKKTQAPVTDYETGYETDGVDTSDAATGLDDLPF